MAEMTVTPSLSSALMPASAASMRPSGSADANAGNAANPAAPAAASPQASADAQAPGPDGAAAPGPDASPFATIMQRQLAQSSAKADGQPAAAPALAPAKKTAAEDVATDPAAALAALLPLIQSLAPTAAVRSGAIAPTVAPTIAPTIAPTVAGQPGAASATELKAAAASRAAAQATDLAAASASQAAVPVAGLAAASADQTAAQVKPVAIAKDPAQDPAAGVAAVLPMIQSLAPNPTGLSGSAPSVDLAATSPKKASAADLAPDPATNAANNLANNAAALSAMIQPSAPNKAGSAELSAGAENGPSAMPTAAQAAPGSAPAQANMASDLATTQNLAATAADKAAITAALSAPTGEVTPVHAKQGEAATPEVTFANLLATAQVPSTSHPGELRASTPLHVETPLGANGWNDNVGDKLVWMVGRQEQHAELVLNPPQLGRVEVSLSMKGDQANAQFVSANPAVRDALEAALPRLREMLANAGVSLGQTQVGSGSANNAGYQSANSQENRDNQSRAPTDLGALRQMSTSTPWLRQGNGMVDVFA